MNMEFKRKLPTPQTVKDMYPVTEELARQKQENDRQISAVITGEDQRLMLLIGPAVAQELLSDGPLWLAAFLAMGNLAFVLCDVALANITRLYHLKLRKKLHKIL